LNCRTALIHRAVSQKQIDEILIWHPQLSRHFLKVVHGSGIETNGDLTLELVRVGVLAGIGKVVFCSHFNLQYIASSSVVAGRAEINLITESDCL
jgi:hypothetical protein